MAKLPEGVTPEMVKNWKEKYGESNLKLISIPMDEKGEATLEVVAKVPDRRTLSEFEKWSEKDPDKAKSILITNCLLTKLEQVKADDALFFSATNAIAELIPIRKAAIKNL